MKRISVGVSLLSLMVGVLISPCSIHAAGGGKNSLGNDPVLYWNGIALEAVVHDHSGTYGDPEQGGPTRASRALAIVHIAIFDAVNAIDGSYTAYNEVTPAKDAYVEAAVAQAAYETLVDLYPNQKKVFDQELDLALKQMRKNDHLEQGIRVGKEAAMKILDERFGDGSENENVPIDPLEDPELPAPHQEDPLNPNQGLLGPGWGRVSAFSGIDVMEYRTPKPPKLMSDRYLDDFEDVLMLGGDGAVTPTDRTKEQTEIGLFWSYDGSKGIGVPPVLYNQVIRTIAKQEHNTMVENARLFALANIAMADAGIAAWDSKYYFNVWRPVIAIRAFEDENGEKMFSEWTPLGAPASNQSGNNFTPPFPAYPSGHAAFGAAMFRTLSNFYGTDQISFQLKSDEMSGQATDNEGTHRYTTVRRFDSFTQGADENARSRIFLGIHWQFDADAGVAQGEAIADHVSDTLFQSVPNE